jgi:hypothetical protein
VILLAKDQYVKLAAAEEFKQIVLWFDACLFDQSMLVHILTCMHHKEIKKAELLCVDAFPGIEPYNGLGQLQPSQMASVYDQRKQVTNEQFQFDKIVDEAFANQDHNLFSELSKMTDAPLPLEGPLPRLPQWEGIAELKDFRIKA